LIDTITLSPVKRSDYQFLYDLLLQRRPLANISHKRMPTYDEHVRFVKSRPYSKWYVITYTRKKVGSIYLSKQNEIGIHLMKSNERKFIYLMSIKKLIAENPRKRYLANISPQNKNYIRTFKEIGFKLIQHTYERDERVII
jgi:hypothetical protein